MSVSRGDHAGFFVNNRYEWSVTDYALQALGAVSVPRGSDTAPKEVQFIYHHSDSSVLILENLDQLTELRDVFLPEDWAGCRRILVVDRPDRDADPPAEFADRTHFFEDLFARGAELVKKDPELLEQLSAAVQPGDLLTIETGHPWTSDFGIWLRGQPKSMRLDLEAAMDSYLSSHGPHNWAFDERMKAQEL